MPLPRRVLVVDDDQTLRDSLADALREDGYEVSVADGGTQALATLDRVGPEVIVSDVRMDDLDGLALLRMLRERAPDVDVVMMTAFDDMSTVVSAMRDGAVEFLSKPLDLHEVRVVLARVFDDRRARARARREAGDETPSVDGLVGRAPQMIAVYKLIGQTAATRATVLIRGESGTGKEVVARAIHANSPHAAEPFVAVNCAALPSTLLESELFGHVRGAFTGAVGARKGRFALAGRGTIFLDEIGDTSLDFQSKLLRVLQNREYQPVGAEHTEQTDARVLAATHQNLEAMVAARRFREDLYYRLRVVEIVIPPLRERRGDIPIIARHMIRRSSAALATPAPVLSSAALEKLMEQDWPGNVRELKNSLMRAVLLAAGSVIRPEHLSVASPTGRHEVEARIGPLSDVERDHVARVLEATGGHKSRTAEVLGVSRARLNRLLEKYGLA